MITAKAVATATRAAVSPMRAPMSDETGHAVDVGLAEVTSHQLGEEMAQLRRQRAAQAPLPAQGGDCGGGGMDPEHGSGRVPWLQVHQKERSQGYPEYHQHRSRHAPGGVTQHQIRLARRPRGGKPLPG